MSASPLSDVDILRSPPAARSHAQSRTPVPSESLAQTGEYSIFGLTRAVDSAIVRERQVGFTLILFGVATIIALLYSVERYFYSRLVGEPLSLSKLVPAELVFTYAWALLTPVVMVMAKRFPVRWFAASDTANEPRGKGQVGGACLRFVRTIFDRRNSPEEVELVLGEVITMPGRWSSYPPHHHPQPEIYHYRFTKPQGFGHAELGEQVLKVRQNDTVKILDGLDHAQCAAPGYGMYYAWVIRHLPDNPYTVPDFTPEHAWVNEPGATSWFPDELRDVDSGGKA